MTMRKDKKYFDFEQLPDKHASIDHKIAYTTEINRVRLLKIALRDKNRMEQSMNRSFLLN